MSGFNGWSIARTIVLSDAAAVAIDAARSAHNRIDDLWQSIEWHLSRKGHELGRASKANPAIRLHAIEGNEIAKTPDVWLVFEVSDDEIEVIDVKFVSGRE